MPTPSLAELPIHKLKHAVHLREQIEALKSELGALLGNGSASADAQDFRGRSGGFADRNGRMNRTAHGLSAAGRARIAAAQRERWTKYRADHPHEAAGMHKAPRLSPAGRAKVAAAVRARWKRFRAEKIRALQAK